MSKYSSISDLVSCNLTDDCIEWVGAKTTDGYGRLIYNGKQLKAHRVALSLFLGRELSREEVVCHTCDNPSCYNPKHLYSGTPKSNSQDMISRKRWNGAKGETHPRAKLTNEQVEEVRNTEYYRGVGKDLAEKYSVSTASISEIRNYRKRN